MEPSMSTPTEQEHLQAQGLYDPAHEHDACGVGFVAHIKGEKSHAIIGNALKILQNLDHRGAVGADALMGDGAGILIQMPDALYRAEMAKQGVDLPPPGEYGVGMIFLPKEHASRLACEQELERAIRPKARCCWAGATCRSTATCRCRPPCATRSRSSARSSSAAATT
jgi:glutamate synthase (NADPH/NADH) large chain/glutamate synthase (ferredoxin)